jgi:hypothetical protein
MARKVYLNYREEIDSEMAKLFRLAQTLPTNTTTFWMTCAMSNRSTSWARLGSPNRSPNLLSSKRTLPVRPPSAQGRANFVQVLYEISAVLEESGAKAHGTFRKLPHNAQ